LGLDGGQKVFVVLVQQAQSQWIKTVSDRGWFAYIRIYGPEQAAFDGSWKPGDFEQTK
jgi:hypothetical protein